MIDVPLENAINMRSVWTAWFQFWGKRNIVNAQAKKTIKMQRHLVIAFCVPDGHLKNIDSPNSSYCYYL